MLDILLQISFPTAAFVLLKQFYQGKLGATNTNVLTDHIQL